MLPKYFVVQFGGAYKLFLNTVYKSAITLDTPICVLWPRDHIEARDLGMRLRNERKQNCFIRKWNSQNYDTLDWSYTGSEMRIKLLDNGQDITAPLISVPLNKYLNLPFNTCAVEPTHTSFLPVQDNSTYTMPSVYNTDPALAIVEPVALSVAMPVAMPVASSVAMPVATSVALPVASSVALPVASSVVKSLPSHISKIVIADAIRKNESCPISCDDITELNATVTPCGHVFTKAAIQSWLSSPASKGLCPVCKQSCL